MMFQKSILRHAVFTRGERGGMLGLLRRCHPLCGRQRRSSMSSSWLVVPSSSHNIHLSSSLLESSSSSLSSPSHLSHRGDCPDGIGSSTCPERRRRRRRQQQSLLFARRNLSISRHPDPLVRHGNINTLDDDDDVDGDAANLLDTSNDGGEIDSKTRKVVLTADDYEYMDDILNWGVSDNEQDGLGKKKKKNSKQGVATDGGDDDTSYDDIFGTLEEEDLDLSIIQGRCHDDQDQDPETLAYHARQAKIKESLDSRTAGRLWKTSWNITDDEWMTDEEWDDIEEWKPTLATRKSLESVRVYEDTNGNNNVSGVPTLQALSELRLPNSLPQHPGYGNPSVYATYRRRQIAEKVRSAVVRAAREDVAKMVHPSITNDQRRYMVDELYECIVDRVRELEPVLGKLPDFAKFVEVALEEVLISVRNRAVKLERDAMIKKKKEKTLDDAVHEDGDGEVDGVGKNENEGNKAKKRASSISSSKSSSANDDHKLFVNSVMEVLDEYEMPTPVFMDVLMATRNIELQTRNQRIQDHAQPPLGSNNDSEAGGNIVVDTDSAHSSLPSTISKFFASSDESGVPNLLYPLTVHPKEGVGRMVEEWQLAANKETKRIMIRDAMRDVARAIVEATSSAPSADTAGGAARVFVAGKRGVGKVSLITIHRKYMIAFIQFEYLTHGYNTLLRTQTLHTQRIFTTQSLSFHKDCHPCWNRRIGTNLGSYCSLSPRW